MNTYIPYVIRRKPEPPKPAKPVVYKPFKTSVYLPRIQAILKEEADEHYTTPEEIISKSRLRNVVWARHDAVFRIYEEMDISTIQLGRFFGDRDHSTIVHAVQRGRARHELRIAIQLAVEGKLKVSNI